MAPPPSAPQYKPCALSWRWVGLALCVVAAVTQLTLSPSSRQLIGFFTTLSPTAGAAKGGRLTRLGGSGTGASAADAADGTAAPELSGCDLPAVGKPLNYREAVQRYVKLPWTMRRAGAKTEPLQLDDKYNLSCFTSPYVEGGPLAAGACSMVPHIYYPSAPASPKTAAPDWAQRKLARCAAMKAAIAPQRMTRASVGDAKSVPLITNGNITCGPEQLCYYPNPLGLDNGGYAEQVNTELGVEIGAYLPFFHYEASVGELAQSKSNYDSSAFYFWSPRHCEWDPRVQRFANGIGGRTPWPYSSTHFGFVNVHVTRETYPRERFVQPPWGPHYCGWGLFPFLGQRYAFIHNKRKNVEFMGRMVNTIQPETLTQLYDLLKDHYVVVYQRPTAGLFKSESDGFSEAVDDITTLEEHAKKVGGSLYVMPRILKDFMDAAAAEGYTPDEVSLNEVQMTIIAEADIHISVQGGPAYMSMLWGADKTALLVQRKSPELPYEATKWFDLLSGMRVENTYSDRDLVIRARDMFQMPLLTQAEREAFERSFWGVTTEPQQRAVARLREACLALRMESGGGESRYEVCLFRSAAQIVLKTEEVYMLGYWEGVGKFIEGTAPGSDPALAVPAGQEYDGGTDCDGAKGTPRRSRILWECDAKEALLEPRLVSGSEPSMCVYELRVQLPHDLCFGQPPDMAEAVAGYKRRNEPLPSAAPVPRWK